MNIPTPIVFASPAISTPFVVPTIQPPPTIPFVLPTLPIALATPAIPQTPACAPTSALPAGVLFSDDFGSRQVTECNGWDIKVGTNSDYTWAANQLLITPKRKQWVSTDTPNGEYTDFAAETVALPIGNNYAEYGLAFRDSGEGDSSNYYVFGIQSDGKYYLQKLVAGNWVDQDPVSPTASPASNCPARGCRTGSSPDSPIPNGSGRTSGVACERRRKE